jgi:hypothetical protein
MDDSGEDVDLKEYYENVLAEAETSPLIWNPMGHLAHAALTRAATVAKARENFGVGVTSGVVVKVPPTNPEIAYIPIEFAEDPRFRAEVTEALNAPFGIKLRLSHKKSRDSVIQLLGWLTGILILFSNAWLGFLIISISIAFSIYLHKSFNKIINEIIFGSTNQKGK